MVTTSQMDAMLLPQAVKIDYLAEGQKRLSDQLDKISGLSPRVAVLEAQIQVLLEQTHGE